MMNKSVDKTKVTQWPLSDLISQTVRSVTYFLAQTCSYEKQLEKEEEGRWDVHGS